MGSNFDAHRAEMEVATAATKAGDFASIRNAYRRSAIMIFYAPWPRAIIGSARVARTAGM